MFTSNLKKIVDRRKKRVGRGGGSGKGFHTAGRGQKGQSSRAGSHERPGFIGGQKPVNVTLPKYRKIGGKRSQKPVAISIDVFLKKGVNEVNAEAAKSFTSSENFIIVGPKSYNNIDLKKVNIAKGINASKALKTKVIDAGGKVDE